MKMIYNVNDKPKFLQLIVFAIQQLLAIMAATLVVPVIVGNGMQPSAALFGAAGEECGKLRVGHRVEHLDVLIVLAHDERSLGLPF